MDIESENSESRHHHAFKDGSETGKKLWKQDELQLNLFPLNSPVKDTVVVNDRWGVGAECRHGGFFTCQDRYNPGFT